MTIHDVQLIRSFWLVSLVPIAGLLWWWWFLKKSDQIQTGMNHRTCKPLLRRLVAFSGVVFDRRWTVSLLALVSLLLAVALAGPTWQGVEQPRQARFDSTVVLISLAQSMNATDQSPTRLVRARHKVSDLLRMMDGGQVGLVIYADQPFIALPLTDDVKVIDEVLCQISTDIVSVVNNRLDLAITQAVNLLNMAETDRGQILVLADNLGAQSQKVFDVAVKAKKAGFTVSSILVGSEAGAVVRDYQGRKIVDASGKPEISKLDAAGLRKLSAVGGGKSSPLSSTQQDLEAVLKKSVARAKGLTLSETSGFKG